MNCLSSLEVEPDFWHCLAISMYQNKTNQTCRFCWLFEPGTPDVKMMVLFGPGLAIKTGAEPPGNNLAGGSTMDAGTAGATTVVLPPLPIVGLG